MVRWMSAAVRKAERVAKSKKKQMNTAPWRLFKTVRLLDAEWDREQITKLDVRRMVGVEEGEEDG